MTVAHWFAAHRRSILFLIASLALGGALSAVSLPVSMFPHVDFPRVVISIEAGDRPADQMVVDVTRPAESIVRSIPGVFEVRSTTSRGSAELSINFDWGRNMEVAALQIQSAISQLAPSLPFSISFSVRRMDPTKFPVLAYSLTSESVDLVRLREIAEYELMPLLSSVTGVARVAVTGGDRREYRVEADPALLTSFNLTLDEVAKALAAANNLSAVGRVEDLHKLFLVLSDTRLRKLDDIRRTIIRSGPDGFVELEDIATVTESTIPKWLIVTANGKDAVSVEIYQQPAGNTVNIVKDVGSALAAYRARLPPGVTITPWYDQSTLITTSAASVRDSIFVGVGLAALVLLVFLRNWRTTLIALAVVPAVLSASILLLYVLGMSFNIMTLGGMAAAIGLIVDDAIVMIEQIVRNLKLSGERQHEHIRQAVREFLPPLMGSSASTIVIFLPLAFLGGVTGAFFKALSLTVAIALLFSFFFALAAIPLLADRLLTGKDAESEVTSRRVYWLNARYAAAVQLLAGRPLVMFAVVAIFAIAGYFAYRQVGSGFMPRMDEGGFVLDYRSPAGTSLQDTDALVRQVEVLLQATPEVVTYSRRTGIQLSGDLTEANEGDFFVRLKPLPRRSVHVVIADLRRRIEATVPGLKVSMAQLMEDLIGDLTAVPQPIEVKIFGDDVNLLLTTAPKVATVILAVKGAVEVRDGIVFAGDAAVVTVDRAKAALEGLDPNTVTAQVRAHLSGLVATNIQKGDRTIGIRVWIPMDRRKTIPQISNLRLRSPRGHVMPLSRVAEVTTVAGQPQITRDNLKAMIAVTARIEGRDLGSTVADVTLALQKKDLFPAGTYYELGGLYRQQQIAFRGLVFVIIAAFGLVILLLLFMYESIRVVLAIALMPLLAMSAVLVGLWTTGIELNVAALMGMTMVVGIITEVAIFFFSEVRRTALVDEAPMQILIRAGTTRMRPIAMTTIAAALALAPLALGIGEGSAMQQPLAVAIISGLVVQLPLVLVVMPALFACFGGMRVLSEWRRAS